MSLPKCACDGCVYWARFQDSTLMILYGTSYQCPACFALTHDPSDQRTPVLPPSALTPAPKWEHAARHPRVPRLPNVSVRTVIVEHGFTAEQFAYRGRSDRARPWTKVRKLRMYTKQTNHTMDPPGDGACWAP